MRSERILVVIDAMSIGGAQKVLLALMPQWVSLGHQVELLLLQDNSTELDLDELRLLGIRVRRVRGSGLLDVTGFIRFLYLCSAYKPTQIHSHLYWSQIWSGIFKIVSRNLRLIWVEHNTYFNRTRLQWFAYRVLSINCEKIIAVSFEVKDFLSLKGLSKTHVILNPISPVFVRSPIRERKLWFILLGRLNQQKNPWLAIDSFEWALSRNLIPRESKLIIAGDGPLLEQLKTYVGKKACCNSVHFLGFLKEPDVVELLQGSTALISSSNHEGFPLVRVEALAVGLGVITTMTGGVNQYLTKANNPNKYVSGVFVVEPNIKALANAMFEITQPEYWTADSIASRIAVSRRNDPLNIAASYLVNFSSSDRND